MQPIEFFISPGDSDIVIYQNGKYHIFSDLDTDIIQFLYEHIQEFYPSAFKVLQEIYNKAFNFKYLITRRFIKCNFSNLDENYDIQADNSFKLELVKCPMRGECKYEGIICKPVFNSSLSKREIEVLKLLCRHFNHQQISEMLFISIHTVDNHSKNILHKINGHDKASMIEYATKNNLL